MSEILFLRSRPVSIRNTTLLERNERLVMPGARLAKRIVDCSLVIVTLPLTFPVMLLVAIFVKLGSKGPLFYRQERLGTGGKLFFAYKFRTMRPDADRVLENYLQSRPDLQEEWQEHHKLKHDPRIAKFGHALRKTSLDEIPQLLNVLRGEMSLVGPRPIVKDEIPRYGETYKLYRSVLPGLTGLWQVSGRNDTTYEERVQFDKFYVRNWSPWLDLYILLRTIRVILLREGAY